MGAISQRFISTLAALPPSGGLPNEDTATVNRLRAFRGIITKVHMTNETLNTKPSEGKVPTMTFDVSSLSGWPVSGAQLGHIEHVPMVQPGFGDFLNLKTPGDGIIYVPPVGSRVLVIHDGVRWVIIGFYSGPVADKESVGKDPLQARLRSHNPGIELALNRLIALPGVDIPWLYGIEPGDTLICRDYARVKICSKGVVLSSNGPNCVRFMKTNGEILERFAEYEGRAIGWWHRLHFMRGTEKHDQQHTQSSDNTDAPKDGSVYRADVLETTPYPLALKPYIVHQTGHISRSYVDSGRSCVYDEETKQVIKDETENKDYAVMRTFVAQPLKKQPSPSSKTQGERQTAKKALELSPDGTDFEVYDHQVDANGSFRLRAGNKKEKKKGQSTEPTKELDLSVEYKAKEAAILIRIGIAGAADTTLVMTGLDTKTATAHLRTTKARIFARERAVVCSKKIVLQCSNLEVTGKTLFQDEVEIRSKLKVSKTVKAKKYLKGGGPGGNPKECKDEKQA